MIFSPTFALAGWAMASRQRDQQRGQGRRASCDRSALETGDSHTLTVERYQRLRETPRRRPSAREKPLRPGVVAVARARRSRRRAQLGAQLRRRARAARSRRPARARRRAGTIRPLSPSRTSPPAAAPTASVAITASPWFMASLTTNPHGSRKVRGRDRRHDQHVARRVHVAQLLRRERAEAQRPARRQAPAPAATDAGEPAASAALAAGSRPARAPCRGAAPAGPSRRRAGRRTGTSSLPAAGQRGSLGGRARGGPPEVVVDRLRGHVHVARAACAHVGADVRAVGHDRVGRAVQAAQRQVAERVRGAARVRPQRSPQDQRHAARGARPPTWPSGARRPPVGHTTAR